MKQYVLVNFAANCYKKGSYTQVFVVLNKHVVIEFFNLFLSTSYDTFFAYTTVIKRILK